jgi:hypothetical protein
MSRIKLSPASILRSQAQTLRAAGRDVISLSSGDLDFPTPDAPDHSAKSSDMRSIILAAALRPHVLLGMESGFGQQ